MIENENSRIVIGEGGWRGRLDATPASATKYVVLHPEDRSPSLILPFSMMEQGDNGTFHLPLTRSAAAAYSQEISNGGASGDTQSGTGSHTDRIVVPVIEEMIEVRKQMVDTGNVRIVKSVHERQERIDEPLRRETVEVTRVPVGQFVDAAVPAREEGSTLIIPVYEERMVVQKQLFLKEELHVTRQETVDRQAQQTVTLRSEEVNVERYLLDDEEDVLQTRSDAVVGASASPALPTQQ
ncbi:MAG: YsnF/AvaK domain-containing protein [Armatimonadota bacterium]